MSEGVGGVGKGTSSRQVQRNRKRRVDSHLRDIYATTESADSSACETSVHADAKRSPACHQGLHCSDGAATTETYQGDDGSAERAQGTQRTNLLCSTSDSEYDVRDWEENSVSCSSTDCEDARRDAERNMPSETNFGTASIFSSPEATTLAAQLALWAVQARIPLQHLSSLLCILCQYQSDLPRDARTLLSTPRNGKTDSLCGGEFVYLGILNSIKRLLNGGLPFSSQALNLQINVDGLPLYHSQNTCFWPILVAVQECIHVVSELNSQLLCFDVHSIKCKVVRFPLGKGFLVVPLLHTA
ncbi:uncharacterized protein LOC135372668 [Ornithodoros turicata]|uniref:uncharacterized protein LOC135372668 n=1 Tax=Ornithodoros turicata TaxID=34597 RepID=UPI0031390FCC